MSLTVLILISLQTDCLIELEKCSILSSGFRHQILSGSMIRIEKPKLLMNAFSAPEEIFRCTFYFSAAGVVRCGGRETTPSTASIVQIIFQFCS